jgi:hypothetical protein
VDLGGLTAVIAQRAFELGIAVARAHDGREMRPGGGAGDGDSTGVVTVALRLRAQEADRSLDLVGLAREYGLRGGAEIETRDGEAALDEGRHRHC